MDTRALCILCALPVALLSLMAVDAIGGLRIAEDGKARATIVVAADAIPAERAAAQQLGAHLTEVTGGSFPVRAGAATSPNAGPIILVGDSAATRALLPDVDWAALGQDGIVIRTAGDRLVLTGGRPRGTLYAVNTFLEDIVGIRWWTSTERTIPQRPTLDVPDQNVVYAPPFRYREPFYKDAIGGKGHAAFAMRLRANGHHCEIPPELGGHYTILGWCHTAYHLLPPDKHFATHPEWYSLRGGKRKAEGGQLCWSDAGMRQALTREALAWIEKNPSAGIISISQNDWHGACECDDCRAIDHQEGSQAGSLIHGVNAVAAEISRKYPYFLVETLAYQYTRKPPSHVRPADNVLVRLCSIEADFTHPLAGPSNVSFGDDLRGWSKIARNLFVWNYVTNFSNYLIPHPNLTPLAEDLRFFADHNVVGVFEQGDYHNAGVGDFIQLRAWVLGHLLWDPTLDQHRLVEEFLVGYYGAAGPHLGRYLKLVNAVAERPGFRMGCYNTDTHFLTDGVLAEAEAHFDRAEAAVAGDVELARRVRRERLVLEHVRLLRYDVARRVAESAKGKADDGTAAEAVAAKYEARARRFVESAREAGVRHVSEGQSFDAYARGLLMRARKLVPPRLPAAGDPLPPGAIDIQEDRFTLYRQGELSELVDPKASNGRAARIRGGHTEWAVQFHVPRNDAAFTRAGPWLCYVLVRTEGPRREGSAFAYGLYDAPRRAPLSHDTVSAENGAAAANGHEGYRAYGISVDELRPGMYVWVAPTANPNVEAIYIDRIYLAPHQPASAVAAPAVHPASRNAGPRRRNP